MKKLFIPWSIILVILFVSSLAQAELKEESGSIQSRALQNFNPDVSVIIDGYYHYDNSREGLGHIFSEIEGFSHSHGSETHQHGPGAGFNLNHLELTLSGQIDPVFKAQAGVAVSTTGAEIHEAFIETPNLGGGLAAKFGKFFSDFGRINPQHTHQCDFVEKSLVNNLLFGAHGVNDIGLQLSWLMPLPVYVLMGIEGFQGDNETIFPYIGGDTLSTRIGPRIGIGWFKFAPNLPDAHGLQIGLSYGYGIRQEAHDGNSDGIEDHWLDGNARFLGGDVIYKYDSNQAYGKGDFALQLEYIRRDMDVQVVQHTLNPALIDKHKIDAQDGYYIQLTYGFLPRWRAGLRWDQVGLVNETLSPEGTTQAHGSSNRTTLMTDFSYTEFSRCRLQVSNGIYVTGTGAENIWSAAVQVQISLGVHGAHSF